MALPPYATRLQRIGQFGFRIFCALGFLFLVAPNLVIIPLSFNVSPYFVYPLTGVSLRWYEDLVLSGLWGVALRNSIIVGVCVTILATILGTLASLGLVRREFPLKGLVMNILLFPIVVPTVITAVGMYFAYARVGLVGTYLGLILAHTTLATPFVLVTVTATLTGFDQNLTRAGSSLGAGPAMVFFRVTLPLILPGVVSGMLFAFATSFDELVVALFVGSLHQRTVPRQMWSGIREMISPTILTAATLLLGFAFLMMAVVDYLGRRSERLRAGSAVSRSDTEIAK